MSRIVLKRTVAVTADVEIYAVYKQGKPRRLMAIIDGESVSSVCTNSGVEFDHYEYVDITEVDHVEV